MEQDNHYYPYGMMMGESGDILDMARPGSTTKQSDANPYLYGGKEYMTTAGVSQLTQKTNSSARIDAYITITDPLTPLQDRFLLVPRIDGVRHYVRPGKIDIDGHCIYNFYDPDTIELGTVRFTIMDQLTNACNEIWNWITDCFK